MMPFNVLSYTWHNRRHACTHGCDVRCKVSSLRAGPCHDANWFENHSTQDDPGSALHSPGKVGGSGSSRAAIVSLLVPTTSSVVGTAGVDSCGLSLTAAGGWDGGSIVIFVGVGCCNRPPSLRWLWSEGGWRAAVAFPRRRTVPPHRYDLTVAKGGWAQTIWGDGRAEEVPLVAKTRLKCIFIAPDLTSTWLL